MTKITDAASAYANVLKNVTPSAPAKTEGESFASLLAKPVEKAVEALRTNEKVSADAVMGNASMAQVLQAANEADIALNTVLALRDRFVQAYEQIMRTPM